MEHSEYKCVDCNLLFNGPIPLEQHMKGNVHLINKKTSLLEDLIFQNNKIIKVNNQQYECTVCDVLINGLIPLDQHLKGQKHLKKNKHPKPDLITIQNDGIFEVGELQYKCTVCNALINGPIPLEQHLKGVNHSKNKMQSELKTIIDLNSLIANNILSVQNKNYTCNVCKITCSGIVPINTHLTSINHCKAL